MTSPTQGEHAQTEALDLADDLESFAQTLPAYGFNPKPLKDAADELRRLAALVEAQQPAPLAAAEVFANPHAELRANFAVGQLWQYRPRGVSTWTNTRTPNWLSDCEYRRHPDDATAPRPSPTPQADSQPAPVLDYPPLPNFDSGDEPIWDAIFNWKTATPGSDAHRKANAVESAIIDQLRAYVDADRAARAPADSVTAPAGWVDDDVVAIALARYKVVPSHESMFHRFAVVAGDGKQQLYLGREVECENMARKFAGAFLDGVFYQSNIAPTPPAQAADSVLEDAAEYFLEAQAALDNREGMGINAEPYEVLMRRRNRAWDDLEAALSNARKQGGA